MNIVEEKVKLVKNDTVASKHIQGTLTKILELLGDEDCADAVEYVDWIKAKTIMRHHLSNEKNFPLFITGVYYVNFGRNIGAELEKDRPCILLFGSKESETVVVIPIPDQQKYIGSTFGYHVPLSTGDTALVEQIRTVSKTRIRRPMRMENSRVRSISSAECKKVNDAIDKLKCVMWRKKAFALFTFKFTAIMRFKFVCQVIPSFRIKLEE